MRVYAGKVAHFVERCVQKLRRGWRQLVALLGPIGSPLLFRLTIATGATTLSFLLLLFAGAYFSLNRFFDESMQRSHLGTARLVLEGSLQRHPQGLSPAGLSEELDIFLRLHPASRAFLLDSAGAVTPLRTREQLRRTTIDPRPAKRACETMLPDLPAWVEDPFSDAGALPFSAACAILDGIPQTLVLTLPNSIDTAHNALPFWCHLLRWFLPVLGCGALLMALATMLVAHSQTRVLTAMLLALRRGLAGDLSSRITDVPNNELGVAARAWNALATTLEQRRMVLHRALQERRWFFATLAHDIRTPIAAMRGALETLRSTEVSSGPALRSKLSEIARHAHETLGEMLSELHDLSGSDATARTFTPEPFILGAAAEEATSTLQAVAEAKGVTLVSEGCDRSETFDGDVRLIERVVANLVMNAVRHTPSGGTVRTRLTVFPEEFHIEIEDTGEGIPAADLPFIFHEYYRGEEKRSGEDHAGIGLAIVRRFVEMHEGRVRVTSTQGSGTCFTVELPRKRIASTFNEQVQSSDPANENRIRDVLLSSRCFEISIASFLVCWWFRSRILGMFLVVAICLLMYFYLKKRERSGTLRGPTASSAPPLVAALGVCSLAFFLPHHPSSAYFLLGALFGATLLVFWRHAAFSHSQYRSAALLMLAGMFVVGGLLHKPELFLLGGFAGTLATWFGTMSISTRFAMNLWIRLGCAVSSILVVLCALHIYVLLGRSEQYEALLVRSDASNVLRTIVPLLVNRSPIREPEFFRYASNVFALAPRYDVVIAEKTGSVILQSSIFNPEASWITNTQPYEPHPEAPALLSRKLWKAGSFEFDMLVPAPELGPELMVGIMAEPMSLRVGHFKILQKYATFLALFGLFGGPSLSFLLGYLAIRPLARQLEAIAKRLSDYMPGTGPLGIPLLAGADETREIADSLNRIVDAIGLEDQAIAEAERARRALLQSVIDDLSSPYRQATEQLRLALPPDVGNIDNLHLTRTLELTAEQERLATLLLELARLSHRREKPILESYLIAEVASDAIGALNAAGRHFTLSVDAKSTSVELTGDIEAASRMIRIVLEGLESRRADQFAAGVPVTVAPVDAPVGTPLASLENPPNISVQLRTGKDDRSELFVEVEIRSRSELDGLSREVLSEYTSRSGYRFNIAPEPNGSGTKLYTLRFE